MNKILKFLPRNIAKENIVNPARLYNTNHLKKTSGNSKADLRCLRPAYASRAQLHCLISHSKILLTFLIAEFFRTNFAFNDCFNKDKFF